jgi:hypothetical protein
MQREVELVYSAMGEPVPYAQQNAQQGVEVHPSSFTPYVGHGKRCAANNFTCKAYRMKSGDYCVGHAKSMKAKARRAAARPA